ncbi:LamG domain-containing protein [Snuella sedimenti]|uniref:LamG domain-containing protein n=1 Tax=Snuella sedimenti TaxID=2798802 RepID=A0A8J7LT94_9FLAO|nr:LamG domain-containing protein [Snuella sedimenti]MBJ6368061.1 LamG domain-containing protein [Snuella sedimenti]
MKNIYLLKHIKNIAFLLFGALLLVISGCNEDEQGFTDDRYLTNFEYYIDHTNPLTGVAYTEEELAAKTYDPREYEEYAEGQPVELTLVSKKMPSSVKILLGTDFSEISSLTSFSQDGEWYKSENFSSSLENLGLLEIGDKTTLAVRIEFTDGSIGAVDFRIKRVKFFDPNAIIDTFVYLKKSTGETIPLRIDENVTSRTPNAQYGNIVEFDGASNKVEVTDNAAIAFRHDSDYSIGFYVNTTSTDSDPVMVGDQDWGSSYNPGLTIAHRGDNWRVARADGTNRADINHTGAYNDGDWHFLMVTFDRDGSMTMYQDGVSVASADMSTVGGADSGANLFIGQDGTGNYGQYFEGKIGNVYIYDYALTADQVAGISTPLTGVQLKTQDGVIKNVNVTNSGATETFEENRFTYEFEGGTNVTILDPLDFVASDDFSFSFWTKYTDMSSDPCFMGNKDWGSGGNPGFCVYYGSGKVGLNTAGSDSSTRSDALSTNAANDDAWHLVAVTLDRDGVATIYIDGKSEGTVNISTVDDLTTGMPWRIGNEGTGSYTDWIGKIADVVIYDYVLAEDDIKKLIN